MTNKVRGDSPAPTLSPAPQEPALYRTSPGGASNEDRSTPWPSRRHLATLVLEREGWILTPRLGAGSLDPFSSAEVAFAWWLDHRGCLPPLRRAWRNRDPWEPEDSDTPLT